MPVPTRIQSKTPMKARSEVSEAREAHAFRVKITRRQDGFSRVWRIGERWMRALLARIGAKSWKEHATDTKLL
jgi:hypothetical protein